jgi:hypothetical protein
MSYLLALLTINGIPAALLYLALFTDISRHLFYTGSYKADGKLNATAPELFFNNITKTNPKSLVSSAFTLQPIPASMLEKDEAGKPMGLSAAGAPYICMPQC